MNSVLVQAKPRATQDSWCGQPCAVAHKVLPSSGIGVMSCHYSTLTSSALYGALSCALSIGHTIVGINLLDLPRMYNG